MRGSTFQRCGCRDASGKQLGKSCPRRKQRGHGGWWIRYDVPRNGNGGRRQVDTGPFPSKREAEAALAEVLDRQNKGTYVAADRGLTFAHYLDEWMAGKLALKTSTRISYNHHIAPQRSSWSWNECAGLVHSSGPTSVSRNGSATDDGRRRSWCGHPSRQARSSTPSPTTGSTRCGISSRSVACGGPRPCGCPGWMSTWTRRPQPCALVPHRVVTRWL